MHGALSGARRYFLGEEPEGFPHRLADSTCPALGYWPKVRVRKRVRRPKLPNLPKGQAEGIVVWAPE